MDAKVSPQPYFDYTEWTVTETQFDPTHLHHSETVFTLGNGYLGTRGSFEEGYPDSCPATLIHGVYDDVPVVYTELANCPDWLALTVQTEGELFRLNQGEILSYQRQLDLQRGILTREVRWKSPSGKTLDLKFERFASLADQHLLGLRCQVTPVDFDGEIEVQVSINGYPDNQGVLHWQWVKQGTGEAHSATPAPYIWLHVRTRSSGIDLGIASRVAIAGTDTAKMQIKGCEGYPTLSTTFNARAGQTVTLDKVSSVLTSREADNPAQQVQEHLQAQPDYETVRSQQVEAWAKTWQACDIIIEGDLIAQIAARYNLFQLLISAPRHDDRVSIGAKTLSGFGYRGHVFWDTEIFILPVLTLTYPELTRNLLTYRYHTLAGARRKAKGYGYPGAVYAWESADTGDEVTPRWVLPTSKQAEPIRIWCGDREVHITTDVAYALWQYWQATGDDEWMRDYGAEILLDTAVFWGTRVEWNGRLERYELRDVIGPDEYHERVDNNAFTNRMVQWHLETALNILDWLRQHDGDRAKTLETQLDLNPNRLRLWSEIIRRIWIPYDKERDLIEQCQGFFKIEDINLADYEPRTRSMQAILGIEGANDRQVLKQPDVLMLLYLMRNLVNRSSLNETGLYYDRDTLQRNWDYYMPRTDHTYGSSLGPAIHAILACDLESPEEAYEHFLRAAMVDLEDVRGNAAEGIHAASTGGIWQAIIFGFGGVRISPDGPTANPQLPPGWTRLAFQLQWRGKTYRYDFPTATKETLEPVTYSTNNLMSAQKPASPLDIAAVIFDLDGVITDTAEYHYRGWQQLADEEGIAFDREANEAMRGLSRRDSLMVLLGDRAAMYGEKQLQEMMDRKNDYYRESIRAIGPADLLPGALSLLDELKAAGLKVAIGSASKNAQEVIESLGVGDRIDSISDGYSVARSKPAPDLFLHAAGELGVEPARCVVFEDAGSGVEAALAAGMYAVGLGPRDRVGAAHVVLPNLEGARWTEILAQLQQSALAAC
ncbi:beta-phosphoglucomutase [Oscillatoria sp. FACHB-1406]|uniref:beta-phosphoglucomutase n=1 Tax=Oscillatoria sp. FACHB-1406 TaxID=2692846 RepID=UPI001687533E|nr:beta-phosphoglucomutase [Oscillatoria sp. FACHB-1406]MBD2578808.1 beta-phosphoglucomutase [Oscillatoria sp. FACHB-1406]